MLLDGESLPPLELQNWIDLWCPAQDDGNSQESDLSINGVWQLKVKGRCVFDLGRLQTVGSTLRESRHMFIIRNRWVAKVGAATFRWPNAGLRLVVFLCCRGACFIKWVTLCCGAERPTLLFVICFFHGRKNQTEMSDFWYGGRTLCGEVVLTVV